MNVTRFLTSNVWLWRDAFWWLDWATRTLLSVARDTHVRCSPYRAARYAWLISRIVGQTVLEQLVAYSAVKTGCEIGLSLDKQLGGWTAQTIVEQTQGNVEPAPDLVFFKPQTFMNDSGKAVGRAVRRFLPQSLNVDAEDGKDRFDPLQSLIVLHDELEAKPGSVNHKFNGSDHGHRGIFGPIHLGHLSLHSDLINDCECRIGKRTEALALGQVLAHPSRHWSTSLSTSRGCERVCAQRLTGCRDRFGRLSRQRPGWTYFA